MELSESIRRRRMVRSFSGRRVDPGVVDVIVGRSTTAPTAGNTDGWDAVVLEGPDQTEAFWRCTTTGDWRARSRRWPGLSAAPVIVAIFVDPGAYPARYAEADKSEAAGEAKGGAGGKAEGVADTSEPEPALAQGTEAWPVPYWFFDAGLAVMALLLGAVDAGLGACFLGNFRGEAALCQVLGVPAGRRYVGAVLLGEPGGDDPPSASIARARRPRADSVHRGRW